MCSLIVNIESLKKLNVLKSLETYINRYIHMIKMKKRRDTKYL